MAFNLSNLAGLGGLTQSSALLARQQQEAERLRIEQALQAIAVQKDQQQQRGAGIAAKAARDYDPGQIPQPQMAPLGGGPDQLLGSGGGMPQPQQLGGGLASSLPAPGSVPLSRFQDAIYGLETDRGRDISTSSAGALGPMQVMPATARQYGFTPEQAATSREPGNAIAADLYKRYGGNTDLAAIAYNAGPGRADAIQKGAPVSSLPPETQNYLTKLHRDLDMEVGQKGIKLIQQGASPPAIKESTGIAKQAGREIDPQQWGMAGLHQMMQVIDKVDPDAPEAVKWVALGQLNKLLAPEEKLRAQMYTKEHQQEFSLLMKDMQIAQAQAGQAETARHNRAMEGIAGGGKGWQILQQPDGTSIRVNPNTGETAPIDIAAGSTKMGSKPQSAGAFPPDVVDMLADQAMSGDTSWKTNLGRGTQGSENIAAVNKRLAEKMKEQNITGGDLATRQAEFQGLRAGERTLSQRTANIGMRINEAQRFAPLALAASDKVDRTQFPLFNKMLEAGMLGTGDENVVRLSVATQSFLNAYAAAVTPTGTPTEGAQNRAHELLDKAWAQGQFKTAINQLLIEMDAASKSPGSVREEFRRGAAAPAKGGEPVAGPTSGGISGPTDWSKMSNEELLRRAREAQ